MKPDEKVGAQPITVWIPKELWDRLGEAARAKGESKSTIVREALRAALATA